MSKILVIEDETSTRDILIDCLEAEGFQVIAADNGRLGVQQAHVHQPDLILCDIMLPKLDGYGVLDALRKDAITAIIPFIFLTAKNDRQERMQGMAMGADDYITKPFTTTELVLAISSRLQYRQMLERIYAATPAFSHRQGNITGPQPDFTANPDGRENPSETNFQYPEHRQLQKIFAFIETNYHQPIGLNEIAQEFGYSPSYLTSLVRRLTGQTLYQWIVQRRMFQARQLLLETDFAVHQIAEVVGYVDTGHFVKHFRQLHKKPPKTWRDGHRTM